MKKVLSIFLVIVMLCSTFAGLQIPTSAADLESSGSCGDNVTYIFDSETGLLTISGSGKMKDYVFYGSPFALKTNIKRVIINSGVTSIGNYAFNGCSNLSTVSMPISVSTIGNSAFSKCSSLDNIEIPKSVYSIGSSAFSECSSLTSISIPDYVTSIESGAFSKCSNLTTVTISDSVTSIKSDAFSNCSALKELSMPISTEVFYSISPLGGQKSSFYNCTNIEKISLTKGTGALTNYTSTTYMATPWYISRESIKEIVLDNDVASIGDYTFYECIGLNEINIPKSLTYIGEAAFGGCTALNKVTISDIEAWCNINFVTGTSNPLGYAHYLYLDGSLVENLTIPTSITTIRSYAFYGCRSIKNVSFPVGLTKIANHAFFGCTEIKDISIPKNVTSIGNAAFNYCKIESMSVDENNTYYDSRNNCNAIIATNDNILISGCKNTVIPSGVVAIGEGAFGGCTGLTEIEIPETTDSIGNQAFYACSALNTINIKSDNCTIYDNIYTLPSQATIIINGSKDVFLYATNYNRNYICNHVEVIDVEGVKPTCTEGGISDSSHCSVCEAVVSTTGELPALGHNYKEEVIEPTYKHEGYTLHTCTRCGDSYKDSFTDRIPLYYIVSSFAKKESTLVFKNDTNQYIISSNNGHFVINDLNEGDYRVYAKEKNCLTVLIEEYHTNAVPHFVDEEIVLPRGDVNGDGNIDISDISLLLQTSIFGNKNDEYDLNNDGIIDIADLSVILCVDNYGKPSAEII